MVAVTSRLKAGRKRKWVKEACLLPLKAVSIICTGLFLFFSLEQKEKNQTHALQVNSTTVLENRERRCRFPKLFYEASKTFIPKPD